MAMKLKKSYYPRFFLSILALATLASIFLSVISLLHEIALYDLTSVENVQEEGKRLADELVNRSWQLASECLENKELQDLAGKASNSIEGNIVFGSKAREILDDHPFANGLFLIADGDLYFPQLRAGKTYSPLSKINSKSTQEEKDFAALFQNAQKASARKDYESAIDLLKKCSVLEVSDELKAYSLDLQARIFVAAKKPTNAVRIWNRLEDNFADYLNEYQVPYALVAAIEIDEIDAGKNTDRRNTLKTLYQDLLNGRWLLSEEVVMDLKERLEKRLGHATPSVEETHFMRQFQIARLVKEKLRKNEGVRQDSQQDSQEDSMYAQSLMDDQGGIQLFYTVIPGKDRNRILAMAVDREWVATTLLDQCRDKLKSQVKTISDFHIQPVSASGESEMTIPFETVYPFLALRLPEGAVASGQFAFKTQIAVIGLGAVLTLTLLVIIMFLIIRITRERMTLKLRSEFLSHVSHELKTPLTLIQLYTETMLTDENLPEEDRQYSLNVIAKESTHLLNLIENLLHLSKTGKTSEEFKMSLGDVGSLIEKTTKICTEWLRKQGMEIQTQIATGLPLINLDKEKIARAILNLIDNAVKYGDNSKTIDVRAWSENDKVIIEVQDHGPGIAESEKKKIFDQFYRGSNASERRGVGLGLYLVNETMKAHNGSIELDSKVGQGSSFKLIFPQARKASTADTGNPPD